MDDLTKEAARHHGAAKARNSHTRAAKAKLSTGRESLTLSASSKNWTLNRSEEASLTPPQDRDKAAPDSQAFFLLSCLMSCHAAQTVFFDIDRLLQLRKPFVPYFFSEPGLDSKLPSCSRCSSEECRGSWRKRIPRRREDLRGAGPSLVRPSRNRLSSTTLTLWQSRAVFLFSGVVSRQLTLDFRPPLFNSAVAEDRRSDHARLVQHRFFFVAVSSSLTRA